MTIKSVNVLPTLLDFNNSSKCISHFISYAVKYATVRICYMKYISNFYVFL